MKSRILWSSLCGGLVSTCILSGCALEEGQQSEIADRSLAAVVEEEGDCNLQIVAPQVVVKASENRQVIELELTNTSEQSASVLIDAKVISASGTEELELETAGVAANSTTRLRLPRARFGLSKNTEMASIVVGARSELADGEVVTDSTTLTIRSSARKAAFNVRSLSSPPAPALLSGESAVSTTTAGTDGKGPKAEGISIQATVSKTLCFTATMSLQSAAIGEDYWTSTSWIAPARGQRVWGMDPNSVWHILELRDSDGCVSGTFETGSWEFRPYSQGKLGSTTIMAQDATQQLPWATTFFASVSSSTSTQTFNYASTDPITTFFISHASLYANLGALTSDVLGKQLTINTYAAATNASASGVNVAAGALTDKWVVAHELGHYVMRNEANTSASDFSRAGAGLGCITNPSHAAWSREFNSAASNEGFASFFAAAVWNDENQNSCFTRFSGSNINCEDASTGYPTRKMEVDCAGGAGADPFDGDGNETDWQRLYWDLVDPWGATQQATMREVLEFLERGSGWTINNYYDVLQTTSNHASTPSYLESRWDTLAAHNGIDH